MIIAEIGQNFCGDMNLACKLIVLAWENGADLAKFQLYDSEKLYGKKQKEELTFDQAEILFNFGYGVGIEVFFSVFDVERVEWCERIGVKRYKIAFSQNQNRQIINSIPSNREIIISTNYAMADRPMLQLYCVPKYPASIEEYHLDYLDGISDHTIGLDASKIALARGAQIIEKHFAIDHKTGVDAPWSMTPEELKELKRFERICNNIL